MNGGDPLSTQHRNEIFAAKTREEARDLFKQYFERPASSQARNTEIGDFSGYKNYIEKSHEMLAGQRAALDRLMEQAFKEPTGSTERHRRVQEAIDKSQELQQQFREIALNPPQRKQSDLFSTFGSIAMLVGAIAGRRSMQPATASLQAAAGVLEGINTSNDKEFDRDYKVWQTQSGFLEKSVELQNQTFREIMEDERLTDTQRHEKLLEAFRLYDMRAGIDAVERGDMETAYKLPMEISKYGLEIQKTRAQIDEINAHASAERVRAGALGATGGLGRGAIGTEREYVDTAVKSALESNPNLTHEEENEVRRQAHEKWRSSGSSTMAGEKASIAKQMIEEGEKEIGGPMTAQQKANAVHLVEKGGLTGNEQAKMEARIDLYKYSLEKIHDLYDKLKNGLRPGLVGYEERLRERLGDVLGAGGVDNVQFMRDIQYLRMLGTRLLTDSSGRPLSHEASRIDDIVAGIKIGDTGANTMEAFEQLDKLYRQMQSDDLSRLQGSWKPQGVAPLGAPNQPTPVGPAPAAPGQDWWKDSPVVGQP